MLAFLVVLESTETVNSLKVKMGLEKPEPSNS